MSKASEWARQASGYAKSGPPDFRVPGGAAGVVVDLDGDYKMRLITKSSRTEWPPDVAVAFARWILDTFEDAAPSTVGSGGSDAEAQNPQGASGPRATP